MHAIHVGVAIIRDCSLQVFHLFSRSCARVSNRRQTFLKKRQPRIEQRKKSCGFLVRCSRTPTIQYILFKRNSLRRSKTVNNGVGEFSLSLGAWATEQTVQKPNFSNIQRTIFTRVRWFFQKHFNRYTYLYKIRYLRFF